MKIDDLTLEERIRIGRLNLEPVKKVDSSETPIGQALNDMHQERIIMRSVLEKISKTSDSFESRLAKEALKKLDCLA